MRPHAEGGEPVSDEVLQKIMNTPGERLVTRAEAAAFLKVTPASINNYRRRGLLTRYTINGSVRFLLSDVIKILRQPPAVGEEPETLRATHGQRRKVDQRKRPQR